MIAFQLFRVKVGISAGVAKGRYSADTLPRGDRMALALALRFASLDSLVKYFFRRGAAKSTKARTLGTAKRPWGASS
jgi:hypothetical protein